MESAYLKGVCCFGLEDLRDLEDLFLAEGLLNRVLSPSRPKCLRSDLRRGGGTQITKVKETLSRGKVL